MTTTHTYTLSEYGAYVRHMDKLRPAGDVTVIFVNNGYGFEYRPHRVIDIP